MKEFVLQLSNSARVVTDLFELLQRISTGIIGKGPLLKKSEPTNALHTLAIAEVFLPLSLLVGVVL